MCNVQCTMYNQLKLIQKVGSILYFKQNILTLYKEQGKFLEFKSLAFSQE